MKSLKVLVRKSKRAKRLSMRVNMRQGIVVTVPQRASSGIVEQFIASHIAWGEKTFLRLQKTVTLIVPSVPIGCAWKARAKKALRDRARYFSCVLGVDFCGFTLKATATRWGSCSSRGNISIHEKVFFLPNHLSDYILIHELCHRKEMNHSKSFWQLVQSILPDYREREQELKKYHV